MKNERLEKSLKALKNFAEELGYFPTSSEWNAHAITNNYLSVSSITRNTGKTWEQLRKDLNFKSKTKRFSKEEIIMALKKAAEENSGHLTLRKYNEWQKRNPDMPTEGQIQRAFGAFNDAKQEAGLPVLKAYRRKYTIKEVEKALIDCSKELGALYSNKEYDRWVRRKANEGIIYPSLDVVINLTDSIPETKKRLGIPSYNRFEGAEKVTKQEVEKDIYEFVSEQLQPIKYRRWAVERGKASDSTLPNFGGYYKLAIEALERHIDFLKKKTKPDSK